MACSICIFKPRHGLAVQGETPLQFALFLNKRVQKTELLLAHGADASTKNLEVLQTTKVALKVCACHHTVDVCLVVLPAELALWGVSYALT